MKQKAIVRAAEGRYATVEVSRSAMCDGCVKQDCAGHTCAAGALLGSSKTMTAKAKNPLGASVGDTVWVESADKTVLGYAALVFLMPVVVCFLLYAAAEALFTTLWIPYAAAAFGFIASFAVIGFVEKKKKNAEPDIIITDIVYGETEK
ncbi:MAG: SoxR reducing system RseC family protein [Clostridia bacterium]|nr:SoxR reducing system RseC family protein [Clostridia bacterium]